jgi:hypothetical protein
MSVVETDPSTEETYHLLYEGLVESLNNPDEIYDSRTTDYLQAVNDKVNFAISMVPDEDKPRMDQARLDAENEVAKAFLRDYEGYADPDALEGAMRSSILRLIYRFFYLNKLNSLMEFLVSETINNRKTLVERFRKDSKKDLIYARIKNELTFKNPNYIYLIMSYQEIANEALTSNVGSFQSVLMSNPLTFDQTMAFQEIFKDSDDVALFTKFVDNFPEHSSYNHFLISFRDELVEQMKDMA